MQGILTQAIELSLENFIKSVTSTVAIGPQTNPASIHHSINLLYLRPGAVT
jgi:hypothetical protein